MQRLFETEGATFTEYVLAQRLARAHRMLSDPSRDGEKISTVAYDCGFERASEADAKLKRLYDAIENGIADLSDLGVLCRVTLRTGPT